MGNEDESLINSDDVVLSDITTDINNIYQIDKDILEAINISDDINKLNLSKSDEFVINNRGQKIQVRSFFPNDKDPLLLVIYIHGYSTHINTPMIPLIGEEFRKSNMAFVTFDLHGHGYSDGERVYVEKYDDLIDDCISVITSLYSSSSPMQSQESIRHRNCKCPFVLYGISLGGNIYPLISAYDH